MNKKTIDIRTGTLFPFHFIALGASLLIGGIVVLTTGNMILALILLFIGAVMVTGYEGTEISPSSNTYREYKSFLFIKNGEVKRYDGIEKIFINSGKVSQKMNPPFTSRAATYTSTEYNAWLKFTDGNKIFLKSDRDKVRLMNKLRAPASSLNTTIADLTSQ